MDRNGLLGLLRTHISTLRVVDKSESKGTQWQWVDGILIQPDLICPYCKVQIRTTGYIWRIVAPKLIGQFKVSSGRKARFGAPEHPHADHSGYMCKGNAPDYMTGFVSPNPRDGSHGDKVAAWLRKYCAHECERMYSYHGFPVPNRLKARPLTVANLSQKGVRQ